MTQTARPSLLNEVPTSQEKRRLVYYWPFVLSLLVIGLDQWSKRQVESGLGPLGSGKGIELLGGQFRIIYIVNRGASFGFLNGSGLSWIFAVLAIVAAAGIVGWYVWKGTRSFWLRLGMGLVLGGVIGNLLDRLFNGGGVTDILNFPHIEIFKVFNVADSGITVGVTIIIIKILVRGWQDQRTARQTADEQP